ncbi:MAG: hypothetical protein KBT10_09410 [Bacteroidales bacterium]|nr:hypothetical protein [Candidatus Sodaliphilus aphodohippi]
MNIKHFLTLIVACIATSPFCHADDIQALNKQAEAEYLIPVRPGTADGSVPFWNPFCFKFIYAPAFDFKTVKGAKSYRFTVTSKDSTSRSFTADVPTAALSPIWNQIPVGDVTLTVEALDKKGKAIKTVGTKKFLRDYPFHGPYKDKVCSYDECIKRGISYVHYMPAVQYWETHDTPDMSYPYNSYVCKIMSHTILAELKYAEYYPEAKDVCLKRCRNIAKFIISLAQPADAPLAYFPPTYYGDNKAAGEAINKGKTLVMEATEVVIAFIDLYKACGDRQYLDFALHILDTYKKIRRPDGSYPVKVDILTGEPVNKANTVPNQLFMAIDRLEKKVHIYDYRDLRESLEKWTADVLFESFDWNSQFEDVELEGYQPYQNLTNSHAAVIAAYLLQKENVTPKELKVAEDIMRLCEDQFVLWDSPRVNGVPETCTPCVCEQMEWWEPTNASTCHLIEGFALLYKHTGDKLWLAKANALAANLTIMQNKVTGMIPTWGFRVNQHITDDAAKFWMNSNEHTIVTLERFRKLTGQD